VADSVAEFLVKTGKMGVELGKIERTMAEVGAMTVKASVLAAMADAGVNNGKLSGVGRKGAKVGVRYDIQGRRNSALVRATGPFQLIERDTKAHRMPRERKTARAKKRVVVIPNVGVRAWAQHPGTKGKHPWAKGVAAAVPVQEKAGALALQTALRRAYR
jgi:hypothetical protein